MMMMGDEPPKGVGQEPTLEGQNPEASGSADRPLSGGLRPLAEQHTDLGRDQIHRRPVSNRRQQASSLLLPPLSQAHARAAHVARRVSLATTCSASAHTPPPPFAPPFPNLSGTRGVLTGVSPDTITGAIRIRRRLHRGWYRSRAALAPRRTPAAPARAARQRRRSPRS